MTASATWLQFSGAGDAGAQGSVATAPSAERDRAPVTDARAAAARLCAAARVLARHIGHANVHQRALLVSQIELEASRLRSALE